MSDQSWSARPGDPDEAPAPSPFQLDVLLLVILFGPYVRPTRRGLWAARAAIAITILALALVLAWFLGATADAIVDPSPELPA